MLCLWAFFRDIHSRRNKELDTLFCLLGHWFSMAYGDDSFDEGFMAKVWDRGLRVGTPGIYLPIGIIIALIWESVEWEYAMAIGTLRRILDEMHTELELSVGALILSEEGNAEADLCFLQKGGNMFVTNLEAIQSNRSPLPLPDGKGFRYRFLSLIKELVQIMGKKEIQVRFIHRDIIDRLDHALSLEDQKSRDKVEACSSGEWLSGWLQIFSLL
jgi:hypothetical protein